MKKHQDKGIASKGYISEEATETGAKRNKQSKIGIALFAVCCILILLLTGLALYMGVGVRDGENGLNGKSAYELAVEQGYRGTEEEWLESLLGSDGADGKSAYEIAVENGYSGTEEQWIGSLVGTPGTSGNDGKSAYELAVENGYEGTLSEWLLTLVGRPGEQGPQGPQGEKGEAGANGLTPYIGENGNWWIGQTDTDIAAKGLQGEQGAQGIGIQSVSINESGELLITLTNKQTINVGKVTGEKGESGEQGPQGEKGEQGVQGIGIKGAVINNDGELVISLTNDTTVNAGKVVGEKGEQGEQGAQGVGIQNASINEDGELIITLTDSITSLNVGKVVGEKGEQGEQGEQGTAGKDGIGIASITINEKGELIVALSDGSAAKNLGVIVGEDGKDGATWLTGAGVPNAEQGNVGDLYIDTSTCDIYQKGEGGWGAPILNVKGEAGEKGEQGEQGEAGQDGKDGATWLTGTTAPNAEQGNVGDLYLDTSTCDIYQKGEGGWGAPILNVKGEAGEKGEQGEKGSQGEKGEQGERGSQGEKGEQGEQGEAGEDGKDGATWLTGTTAPNAGQGKDGDFYFDSVTFDIYNKVGGVWQKVANIGSPQGDTGTTQRYELTLTSVGDYGELSGGGSYVQGEEVTIIAKAYPVYEFLGWYHDGTLVSQTAEYRFMMPSGNFEYVAHFALRDDMENFDYVAGKDFCVITGVHDTTVTEMVVPDCVTDIRTMAFMNCNSLTTLTLPFVERNLGYYWHPYDSEQNETRLPRSLKTIILSEGVTRISDSAFENCGYLERIYFPSTLTWIGQNAFTGCSNLKEVHVESVSGLCSIYMDRYSSHPLMNLYIDESRISTLIIPDGVANIGNISLYISSVSSVIIPQSVMQINSSAFYSALRRVYYCGTSEEWMNVQNSCANVSAATIYYYSETDPGTGNYWHYDTDGVTPVIW